MKLEKYRCIECNLEFEWTIEATSCFMCGSLYVEWLTYDEERFDVPEPTRSNPVKKKRRRKK